MLDSDNIAMFEVPTGNNDQDAMTIALLPELIKKMEETAYAMVRRCKAEAGQALFIAVAAAERSRQSESVQSIR